AFEQAWNKWNSAEASLMVNSGSSANLLALSALAAPASAHPIRPGDEVLVPAICWSTSVFPIVQIGAVPVLVDVDPLTLNMSLAAIEQAIGPKTRGIVVIHVLGNPCPMREIMELARRHDLLVLEDCCEAHGARVGGVRVGNFGDLASFSFFLSHHMTTIEGGMVCMQDPARWRDLLVSQRAHGWIRGRSDEADWKARYPGLNGGWIFVESGYNLRPTEMHAAIGLSQLQRLDGWIARRQAIHASWLSEIESRWGEDFQLQHCLPDHEASPFGFAMIVKAGSRLEPAEIQAFLHAKGIFTRPLIAGCFSRQPVWPQLGGRCVSADGSDSLPMAENAHERGFMIGLHQDLSDAAVEFLVQQLADCMHGR
ncbi:MAG: DegT/DnrJ/EryC1/StrS family aminotransferase, partial [Candidatus Sericytochromatia bacterium]